MVRKIDVVHMLELLERACIVDVRTPSEFGQGHIPGAVNLPLFGDAERAEVGTLYKQEGPEAAMLRGLEIVGPRMHKIPEAVVAHAGGRDVILHCWRGGKRSASIAWLLDFTGTDVMLLDGGYKSFRQHIRQYLGDLRLHLIILGGKTGSGKTEILRALHSRGEQVLDLEGLANHKGSAFGWIGEEPQPSNEHFENMVFMRLFRFDSERPVWVENESRSIGRVFIPELLWKQMKASPLIQLRVPCEDRVERLVQMYTGSTYAGSLKESFRKISRRLGGLNVKEAFAALDEGDYQHAARVALRYYDKTYDYNLAHNRAPVILSFTPTAGADIDHTAARLVEMAEELVTEKVQ